MGDALEGWTVVVTRADDGGSEPLGAGLARHGAEVIELPTVEAGPPDDPDSLDAALADLGDYDWVVFTSARAVDALSERTVVVPEGVRVATVGGSTAARARAAGFPVQRVGSGSGAEALARELVDAGIGRGARVLFPSSSRARPELERVLGDAGVRVDRVEAYRTRVRPFDPATTPGLGRVDVVTFTSPSAVEGWCSSMGDRAASFLPADVRYVTIGDTTADALGARGLDAERAPDASFDGVVAAVLRIASTRPGRRAEGETRGDTR